MSALTPVSIYGRDYKVETPLWLLKRHVTKPAKDTTMEALHGLLEHLPKREGITLPPNPFLSYVECSHDG